MTTINKYLCGFALLGLFGCERSAPEQIPDAGKLDVAAVATPEIPVISSYAQWTCPAQAGTPPDGELVATRIDSANSSREQPGLYEGATWLNGALYFSDFTFEEGFPSRIQRLNADGSLETVLADSGSNGLALDAQGQLIAGVHSNKTVSRFNIQTGEREIIAGTYNGQAFNSPNDLAMARDGSVYFTDPAFQRSAAPGGQEKTQVFRVAVTGLVSVVDDTIENPNGISLSPREDILYVAGGGEQGFVRAYPIVDGVPGAGKNFIDNVSVPDGMAVDCLGNIYVTEHTLQQVRVFSPEGKQLARIKTDANVTNAAFGGPEGKTLYLTGAGAVWSVDLNVAGFPY